MRQIRTQCAAWMAAIAGLLLLAGCNDQYMAWAPSGEYAAVLAQDGLRMCDGDGKLTPTLVENVRRVTWLADSRRLVLAKDLSLPDWKSCATELGAERAAAVEADAKVFLDELRRGVEWKKAGNFSDDRRKLAQLYLVRERPDELKTLVPAPQQGDVGDDPFMLRVLVLAEWEGGKLTERRQLHVGVHMPEGLCVSPDGAVLAYAQCEDFGPDDSATLWVIALEGNATPVRVARRVSLQPDWMAGGRDLVYMQTSIGGEPGGGLQVGTLSMRTVRTADGKIALAEKGEDLAGLIVNAGYRVRCLRDGRILFNAAEFTLPMAEKDFGEEREQLFCLDRGRQATLVRMIPKRNAATMPKGLSLFELSPDESQVIVGGPEGEVMILTLATGNVEVVQQAGTNPKIRQVPPGWRRAGEPWYVARGVPAGEGKSGRRSEVVVGKGTNIRVLSADWPDDLRERMISEKDGR